MNLIDGKAVSASVKEQIRAEITPITVIILGPKWSVSHLSSFDISSSPPSSISIDVFSADSIIHLYVKIIWSTKFIGPLIKGILAILCLSFSIVCFLSWVSIEPSGILKDIPTPFGPIIIMPSISAEPPMLYFLFSSDIIHPPVLY